MPFGPKVLFTKSPMAMAPMKDDLKKREKSEKVVKTCHPREKDSSVVYKRRNGLTRRAVSALSSSAPALKMFTGARERDA